MVALLFVLCTFDGDISQVVVKNSYSSGATLVEKACFLSADHQMGSETIFFHNKVSKFQWLQHNTVAVVHIFNVYNQTFS